MLRLARKGNAHSRHSCPRPRVKPEDDPGISHRNPAAVRLHGEKTHCRLKAVVCVWILGTSPRMTKGKVGARVPRYQPPRPVSLKPVSLETLHRGRYCRVTQGTASSLAPFAEPQGSSSSGLSRGSTAKTSRSLRSSGDDPAPLSIYFNDLNHSSSPLSNSAPYCPGPISAAPVQHRRRDGAGALSIRR